MKKAHPVFYRYNGMRFFYFLPLRYIGKMSLLCILSLIYYFLPEDMIFNSSSTCLIKKFFNVNCPGCGMSRAVWCILHGQYADALNHNKLSITVFFLLMYLMLKWAYVPAVKNPLSRQKILIAAKKYAP